MISKQRVSASSSGRFRSLEIFAGAGGLALGVEKAGFRTSYLFENDRAALDTLAANTAPLGDHFRNAEVVDQDLGTIDWSAYAAGDLDLLSGGPPCQPFSQGGRHRGFDDARDMFPAAARAVEALRPRAFVFENVRGLLRPTMAPYVSYVVRLLQAPALARRPGENWRAHDERLRRETGSGKADNLREYVVTVHGVDAADYGVPQRRHRVFIVGRRVGELPDWAFPQPTHSRALLEYTKHVDRSYWRDHAITARRPRLAAATISRIEAEAEAERRLRPEVARWQTLRDAIGNLPQPADTRAGATDGHFLVRGARAYPGHSGSVWDEPSKTIKAGTHGVPGGENMIRHSNGRVRYFTVREAARLQGFPDDYTFSGAWGRAMRQIGNAVPVPLAASIASSLRTALATSTGDDSLDQLDFESPVPAELSNRYRSDNASFNEPTILEQRATR